MPEKLTIKKYANRRLYDPSQSRYITLADVRAMVMEEVPFEVIDRQNGEDITGSILLQIIMEQEASSDPLFNNSILSQFIRNHKSPSQTGFIPFLEQSISLFNSQQEIAKEQIQKTLSNTPLDSWLQLSEKNMQTWNDIQKGVFQGFTGNSSKNE